MLYILRAAQRLDPLKANPTNTLKSLVGNLPTNCFSLFDRFVGLALKGLRFLKTTLDLVKLGIIKTGWTARIIENNVNEIYLQPSKC